MGERDLLGALLAARGTLHFDRVVMKPGKPLTFATVPRPSAASRAVGASSRPLLVFGLPGNPVSALVCFSLTVAPALRRMCGRPHPLPRRVPVVSASPLRLDPERPEYHRATLHVTKSGLVATSTGRQISSRLLSCAGASALLELPRGSTTLPSGTHPLRNSLLGGAGGGVRHLSDLGARLSALLAPSLSGTMQPLPRPHQHALSSLSADPSGQARRCTRPTRATSSPLKSTLSRPGRSRSRPAGRHTLRRVRQC